MNINPLATCELLIQEMQGQPNAAASLPELMLQVNTLRLQHNWPLASSMSVFNPQLKPASTEPLDLDLKPLRAYWQAGLIKVIKHDRHTGINSMLAGCQPLAALPGEHRLVQLARLFNELLPVMGLNEVDALIELATRFDHFLRDAQHLDEYASEALLRDGLFYLSLRKPDAVPNPWTWNDEATIQLQNRLHKCAKHFSQLLFPQEDTAKIEKASVEKNIIPITDALLFLGETQLRTRMRSRLDKLEPLMLKISVPVQLLMAEALRLI